MTASRCAPGASPRRYASRLSPSRRALRSRADSRPIPTAPGSPRRYASTAAPSPPRRAADVPRRGHHEGAQVAELALPGAALPERGAAGALVAAARERAHVEGERPALRFAERGEAGHAGALDAERDRVVEPEDAELALAGRVGEIGGRRGEPLRRGAVAPAGGAVADRAVGGEVGGRGRQIRRLLGRDLDLVDLDDAPAQLARDHGDLVAGPLVADRLRQARGRGLERRRAPAGRAARRSSRARWWRTRPARRTRPGRRSCRPSPPPGSPRPGSRACGGSARRDRRRRRPPAAP